MCLERIKEKLANLREIFRAVVLLTLTVLTGVVVNFYQILIHKAPIYSFIVSSLGFIVLIRLFLAIYKLIKKMQQLEEEIQC